MLFIKCIKWSWLIITIIIIKKIRSHLNFSIEIQVPVEYQLIYLALVDKERGNSQNYCSYLGLSGNVPIIQ